jgi:predicted nucleic acid-binding protein
VITAVDTNVLLDVFANDPTHAARSLAALRSALVDGPLVACEVVFAEVAAAFAEPEAARRALEAVPVAFVPMTAAAAERAGDAWRAHRRGGGPRDRVIADFLVGAHAAEQADRLLTRDRGFHRAAFSALLILDPAAAG